MADAFKSCGVFVISERTEVVDDTETFLLHPIGQFAILTHGIGEVFVKPQFVIYQKLTPYLHVGGIEEAIWKIVGINQAGFNVMISKL